jgi:hypothetical protein
VETFQSCAVCGRTILAGERPRRYLTPEGEERIVCELCQSRAEQLGWVWEDLAGQEPPAPPRKRRRGAALSALFRGRRGGGEEPEPELEPEFEGSPPHDSEPAPPLSPDPAAETEPAPEPSDREPAETAEEPAPPPEVPVVTASAPPRRNPDPAAAGARVGHAAPESPKSRLQRAIDRFNESEEARTVSGLMRTLGPPWVSIGSISGSPSEVRITVAWELSWYQWGVDLKDELRPVYQLDKGHEISELDSSAQQWNASAHEDGTLVPGLAEEHQA